MRGLMPLNILIDHATTDRGDHSSRSSSLGDDGESSGDTGERLSYSHSPQSPGSAVDSHDANEEDSWEGVDHDDIGPSDSASRPQTSNRERPLVEAPPIEEVAARRPSRRHIPRPHPRHTTPTRTRRSPPSDGPESVDSHEDWQGYAHGPPHPYHRQYANYAANYSPTSAQFQTYPQQSLVPVNQQQMVPFGFSSYPQPPGGPASNYFSPNHHAMGGHMMGPSNTGPYSPPAGYYPYPHHGYPMPSHHLPPQPVYQSFPTVYSPPPPPAPAPAPAPSAPQPASSPPSSSETSSKDDEKFRRLEKLLLDQREEQLKKEAEQLKKEAAAEKALKDKEAAAEKALKDKAAQAEAEAKKAAEIKEAADAAAAKAKAEAAKEHKAADEKKAADKAAQAEAAAKRAAEIKEASEAGAAKAKAEVAKEQKAAEEKKAAEAKAAEAKAAEAEAAVAAATAAAAAAAPPPPPKEKDKPIKFKDAVGRKFSFPFDLCATWSGMEFLIKEAFVHIPGIGPHVAEGHYDLLGPHGEIILPHVWETVIEPDWTITMHMWPMVEEKEEEPAPPPVPDITPVEEGVPPPPPPAPTVPGDLASDVKKPKKKAPPPPIFGGWLTGGRKPKKSVKAKKK